jgi:hypothetical protein
MSGLRLFLVSVRGSRYTYLAGHGWMQRSGCKSNAQNESTRIGQRSHDSTLSTQTRRTHFEFAHRLQLQWTPLDDC